MKLEIKNLFQLPSGRYIPCELNIWQKLWWRFIPGTVIKVKWPMGNIVVNHDHPKWQDMGGAVWVDLGFSSNPNDHYRPWLEKYIGRQGWDWNWGLADNDVEENKLTIKIRKSKSKYVSIIGMMWV